MVNVSNGRLHQKTQHSQIKELRWCQAKRKRVDRTRIDMMQSKLWSLLLKSFSNIDFTCLKDEILSLDYIVVVVVANVDPDYVTDNYHHFVQSYLVFVFFTRFATATACCLPCWRAFCAATINVMTSSTHWWLSRHKATKWWSSLSLTRSALPRASTWPGLPVSKWIVHTCMLSVISWARQQQLNVPSRSARPVWLTDLMEITLRFAIVRPVLQNEERMNWLGSCFLISRNVAPGSMLLFFNSSFLYDLYVVC